MTSPGRYGPFGGAYVPETLVPALQALEEAFERALADPAFLAELDRLLRTYVGRPTPLHRARRLSEAWGGAAVFLKREDLAHTGAHKINNTVGQGLLAARLGKKRLIAETGAGQHGVATATAAALFGLGCRVFMGTTDMARQAPNVARMKLLGAEVVPVPHGAGTLKEATGEAIREWMATSQEAHYLIGSVVGPHPYPRIVRHFQSVIGREARAQVLEDAGRLPGAAVACIGGGSNASGLFSGFLEDRAVRLLGVEAGGEGLATGRHAASLTAGRPAVLHGALSLVLTDPDGQVLPTHSISAGLDYPGVGPELAAWKAEGRLEVTTATDAEALAAFRECARLEGILPALEPAHALAAASRLAKGLGPKGLLLVNLSGRGDKDLETVLKAGGT